MPLGIKATHKMIVERSQVLRHFMKNPLLKRKPDKEGRASQ